MNMQDSKYQQKSKSMSSPKQNYPVRSYSESYITKNKSFFILFTYSISLYNHYWHLRMYLYIYTKSTEVLCYLHTMSNQGFLNCEFYVCSCDDLSLHMCTVGFSCQGIAQKLFRLVGQVWPVKGQLISKQDCRTITSPKKQTLDFYF